MTDHGHQEEYSEVHQHGLPDVNPGVQQHEKRHSDYGKRHEPGQDIMDGGRQSGEHENKTQQIQPQRHHPQQRNGRNIGGHVRRHAQHQARRHEGQSNPAQFPAHAGYVVRFALFIVQRLRLTVCSGQRATDGR